MPWCEQVNCVIYVLNIIIGALIDESISTPGRVVVRKKVHFRRTHFQLGNLHSSLVDVQRTEYVAFLQRGWRVSFYRNAYSAYYFKAWVNSSFPFHVISMIYLSWFLIVSASMHLKILAYTWKCYKWHNHTSFWDHLSLDIVEEVLKNKALCHYYHIICYGLSGSN